MQFATALNSSTTTDCCGTTPRMRLAASGSRATSKPPTLAVPADAVTKPERMWIVVDLPAPLGPSNP